MSWLQQYQALARYNRWMNERLFGALAEFDDEERKRDRGAFFGSIHRTLNHILLADRIWLARVTDDRAHFTSRDARGEAIVISALGQELYADFQDLTRERAQTDADTLAYVNQLDEPALAAPFTYQAIDGATFTNPRWWALTQLFNHQTHHRGQVTTLMMQAGVDPGVTDFMAFMRSEATG